MTEIALTSAPNFDKLEIIKIGNGAVPDLTVTFSGAVWANNTSTNTYAHNLGFIPVVTAYFLISGSYYPLNYTNYITNNGSVTFLAFSASVFTDLNNVYISLRGAGLASGATNQTITGAAVKYYLYRPSAK